MSETVVAFLALIMVVSQGLIVRQLLFTPSAKSGQESVMLTPEVKAYIDSHSAAGISGDDLAKLVKRLSELEQMAGRMEYLRSTLTTLEEAQMRLGKMAFDSPVQINDLLLPARERELQKFRSTVEEMCAQAGQSKGTRDGSSFFKQGSQQGTTVGPSGVPFSTVPPKVGP